MTSRGIRNNNPFNIDRHPDTKWQGAADDQSSDPRFVVFKTPEYGIRAGAKVLLTYQNHDGCKTIRQVIGRFAPPSENNTTAYIAALCAATGYGADVPIDLDTVATMTPFVRGIILHENSVDPYTDAQIAEGIRLAGVADAKPPKAAAAPHVQAQAGALVTGCAAYCLDKVNAAASWAPQIKKAAASLSDYSGVPIMDHAITIIGTAAGVLALLGLGLTVLNLRKS